MVSAVRPMPCSSSASWMNILDLAGAFGTSWLPLPRRGLENVLGISESVAGQSGRRALFWCDHDCVGALGRREGKACSLELRQ